MPGIESRKQNNRRYRAIFLDALGTIVSLEPPWEHLARPLGVSPTDPRLVAAVRAEMAYYRDHSHTGRDSASLDRLRRRAADVLSAELGREVEMETLMSAIRFRPYPDSEPALQRLRALGLRLICVSNWDCSLPQVLAGCGLYDLLDGVVTSAQAGARKPDPAIFEPALRLAGCGPTEALHVGDTAGEDLVAARAAGIEALLIDRDGGGDIDSLVSLADRLARPETMPG